ncbi:MAG: phage tail baseplate protein, partial [Stellaceae bacterium]
LAAQSAGSLGSPSDGSGLAPNGGLQIWIAASPANADASWGGCQVWLSFDDASYVPIGVIDTPAIQGVLASNVAAPAGANPDTTTTLSADLSMSGGELPTGSDGDAANGRTLCYVDGELIAFGLATPTGGNGYDLTDLYRALYASNGNPHLTGTAFLFLDDAIFKYNLPPVYVDQPLYFKFASFNVWGGGLQDLSTVSAVTYVPAGTGLAFSNSPFMALLYNGATISLGDVGNPVADDFECGDIGGAGEVLTLGSL